MGLAMEKRRKALKGGALAQEMGAAEGNLKQRLKGPRIKARPLFFGGGWGGEETIKARSNTSKRC